MSGNWIRHDRRFRIYKRDKYKCVWCNKQIKESTDMTLDHLIPVSKHGSNGSKNLITCCKGCNSSRGNKNMELFAKITGERTHEDSKKILNRIRRYRNKKLP